MGRLIYAKNERKKKPQIKGEGTHGFGGGFSPWMKGEGTPGGFSPWMKREGTHRFDEEDFLHGWRGWVAEDERLLR